MAISTPRKSLSVLSQTLYADSSIDEILVGGSIAVGSDDEVSDVDLWIRSDSWSLEQTRGLLLAAQFGTMGGNHFVHGIDARGVIVDLIIGREPWDNYLPVQRSFSDQGQVESIETEPLDIYTEFWINSYKHRKPLVRGLDAMAIFGFHIDRMLLFRAWVVADSGSDPGPGAFTIHGLSKLVGPHLTEERRKVLGMAAASTGEIIEAIEAYRLAMRQLMPRPSALMNLVLADPVYRQAK